MAKATLSLSAKANSEGEHIIKVRLDITRTNRPQFESPIAIKEESFVDGQIKIPSRTRLNAAYRDSIIKKKADLEAFIAHLNAIAMALPEEARNRQDIMDVYETVKTLSPSEISRTTIITKKREQAEAKVRLVAEIHEARRPDMLKYMQDRVQGMIDGTIKRKGNNYTSQRFSDYSRINESSFSTHDGINIITLTQEKTGTEVSIPIINDNLIRQDIHPHGSHPQEQVLCLTPHEWC